ncbi:hypothetical protein D3C72_2218850 [compost metagenome]
MPERTTTMTAAACVPTTAASGDDSTGAVSRITMSYCVASSRRVSPNTGEASSSEGSKVTAPVAMKSTPSDTLCFLTRFSGIVPDSTSNRPSSLGRPK